eukprot:TRINITY_DN7245_c2_g1_i10.p1 TRINITY_DN7245_c2_g1~~TRINITY_DN7245_c2_g1_i10.p1  ORF type:complete len:532 (-),score=130.17 TRINITY_DN7245_c2_g1_i10:305-1900(-)
MYECWTSYEDNESSSDSSTTTIDEHFTQKLNQIANEAKKCESNTLDGGGGGGARFRRNDPYKQKNDTSRNSSHIFQSIERGGMVDKLLNSTQNIISRVSSIFPLLRSFSRHSSDSGYQSQPPSRSLSRKQSLISLGSLLHSEAEDGEEEFYSHVKVVPGGNVTDDYILLELLGEGAFSKVYLAESKQDKGGLAAVKVINKNELCKDEDKMFLVDKEIEIMAQLDHPNIVKLYEVYINSEEVCLVMELAKGGEVFDKLLEYGSLPEPEAAKLLGQVLEAVSYLHSLGFVHRDLKPENLLYYDNKSNSKVMVTDFGLSDYEEDLRPDSAVCGTATYLAPEVIKGTSSSRAQDMWSLGVISYIILCGYPPFFTDKKGNGNNETELLNQIARGKYKFHDNFWEDVSIEAKDFVRRLMNVNPGRRLTAEEALKHPWIVRYTRGYFQDTLITNLLQAFAVLFLTISFFYLYFFSLSKYFNIEYFFVSWLAESAAGLADTSRHFVRTTRDYLAAVDGAAVLTDLFAQVKTAFDMYFDL